MKMLRKEFFCEPFAKLLYSIMNYKHKLYIGSCIVICAMIVIVENTNAYGQNQRRSNEFTSTQLRAKLERLNTAMDRADNLKKRGYMPKAIEGAKEAVAIAEKEFDATDIIIVKPLFALVELLGKQRRYEEAEKVLEKIYAVIGEGEDAAPIYALGYRIWIARLYIKWNKFDEAESTLMTAQKIIKFYELRKTQDSTIRTEYTHRPFAGFTQSINTELEKVHALQEINRFNIKKKK